MVFPRQYCSAFYPRSARDRQKAAEKTARAISKLFDIAVDG
jgi:hypothetical protein